MTSPRAQSARRDRSQFGETFADLVPRLLADRGWTQRDLARRVDVDPAHICRLLGPTSTGVSPDLMLRIAAAFGISPDFFVEYRRWRVVDSVQRSSALAERLYRIVATDAEATNEGSPNFAAAALLSAPRPELVPSEIARFSRDEIIAAIHRWHERYGEPPMSIDWDPSRARRRGQSERAARFHGDEWPTLSIVRRQFGSMSQALHAAGLRSRPRPIRPRSRVLSREDILEAIREWHRLYGEAPALADWAPTRARRLGHEWRAQRYLAGDWPHLSTVLRRFGTLGAAVEAAGLDRRPPGRHIRTDSGLHDDTRAAVSAQLAAAEAPCGPGILGTRVRAVARARESGDATALRGALIDLAAAALSWADATATVAPLRDARKRAA